MELCEINSHEAVEGLETTSSSMPCGSGIDGVSFLRNRFTMVMGLIEPEVNDCGTLVVRGVLTDETVRTQKEKLFGTRMNVTSHWSEVLIYLGKGVVSKMELRLKLIFHLWEKEEVLPWLRLSASMFFSPGMWCTFSSVLQRSWVIDTNLMTSNRTSVAEKP